MNQAILLLGGNIGNREDTLNKAAVCLQQQAGFIRQRSSLYETAAWGGVHQPDYLNLAIELQTGLPAADLLDACLCIEEQLGRTRKCRWESRQIDIDIIIYNSLILNTPDLVLPHPRMHTRRFVLAPVAELVPHLLHPISGLSMLELLQRCEDPLWARVYVPEDPVAATCLPLP